MNGERLDQRGEDAGSAPTLERLYPAATAASVAEIISGFGLWQRPAPPGERPRVMLNMVATADGRATLAGRSGPISGPADRALFHGLRAAVDGVLVGAGTVRAERYGRMIPAESARRLRRERGLPGEPLACIVTGRMALGAEVPLLAERDARVVLLTSSQASLPDGGAQLDYVRAGRDGVLDLGGALAELRSRLGVASLLCEGGPHLARELLSHGLVDELFLSIAPRLVGGEPGGGEALRILAGAELDRPASLELLSVLARDSFLFLRYGVSA